MQEKLNDKHLHHGCGDCSGSGEGRADGTTCSECKGLGVIEEECGEDCFDCQHTEYCSKFEEPSEPKLLFCGIRDSVGDSGEVENLDLECRFDDGQKFAAVVVDSEFPELAERIASFLNGNFEPENEEE